jgi:hypothetical protein
MVRFFEKLHGVWTPSSCLAVPECETFGFDIVMDQPANCRPERLLLLGTWRLLSMSLREKEKGPLTDPYQIPVRRL